MEPGPWVTRWRPRTDPENSRPWASCLWSNSAPVWLASLLREAKGTPTCGSRSQAPPLLAPGPVGLTHPRGPAWRSFPRSSHPHSALRPPCPCSKSQWRHKTRWKSLPLALLFDICVSDWNGVSLDLPRYVGSLSRARVRGHSRVCFLRETGRGRF